MMVARKKQKMGLDLMDFLLLGLSKGFQLRVVVMGCFVNQKTGFFVG